MRPLYGAIVRMHPIEFRSAFGDQMMSIFEEMSAEHAAGISLYADAVVSLARQWLVRSGMLWKALVSIPLSVGMILLPLKRVRLFPPLEEPASQMPVDELAKITLAVFAIISVILVATVSWSRAVTRTRRAGAHRQVRCARGR